MVETSNHNEIAVYKQIENDVRESIVRGDWAAGSQFASRRELSRRYGVSALTIERAIKGLVAQGFLQTDDRRGTFVSAARTSPQELSSQKATATIGIVSWLYPAGIDHLEMSSNNSIRLTIQAMEIAAAGYGLRTNFFNRVNGDNGHVSTVEAAVHSAIDKGVAAVVVLGAFEDETALAIDAIRARAPKLPVVFISTSRDANRSITQVMYDNFNAGYDAANHLIDEGCRSLLAFAPTTSSWAADRLDGIRAALRRPGELSVPLTVFPDDPQPWNMNDEPMEAAYRLAINILRDTQVPDGVICLQDQAAYGFIRAAREHSLEPGRDYAIIGFDDLEHSRELRLSTMRPPFEQMGSEAVRLLACALKGDLFSSQIVLRWNLIPRSSSMMPTAAVRQKTTTLGQVV